MLRVLSACAPKMSSYFSNYQAKCTFRTVVYIASSRTLSTHEDPSVLMPHYKSLVDRGLYREREYARFSSARIFGASVQDGGKNVEIQWNNGTKSRYHSLWLRQSCHCPSCRHSSNLPSVNFNDVDVAAVIVRAETEGDKVLKVTWSDDPYHTGVFPPPFLKRYSYSDRDREERNEDMKMVFNTNPKPSIPEVAYSDVMKTELGLYNWLKILNEVGICLVKDVPTRALEVKKVAERIAPVHATVYGETFDVTDKPNPLNVAYSEQRLQLHMDQTPYESPPGIQFLHCFRFDKEVKGGNSFFVDIFHVAETLRTTHPEEFRSLVRIPATFDNTFYTRDVRFHMVYQRPHIALNHDGKIVGVTWHPSMIGPLMTKEEDVEEYYRAYKCMATMVNTFPYQYNCRLEEGDLITFNNRRILHGRHHYDAKSGDRHLQGCYVQIDEFKSQVQVCSNTVGNGKLATRVGNLDWQ
ncbi:gamma-butyrobetaine dioxygenase-like [Haliotis asinina]|uniref:gamma-butyrobetaine dioxygenase-like n=1 Tax=Haliotis asinina TaxID=109174 RepID=UPI0035327C58